MFHVLLALAGDDLHGYAILKEVALRTGGKVRLRTGTLYGIIKRLLNDGLIAERRSRPAESEDDELRRDYRLTPQGRQVGHAEAEKQDDAMLRQSGIFRANEAVIERVMDSNDLERERGITILAKNTALFFHDTKINIVDTPGHSDFGGEVERALRMVDGVVVLVDASEGPLPQTRYVLQKALAAKLPPVIVLNKIDRTDARPKEVLDEIYDLFIDLDATEDQLDFPVVYTNARDGVAHRTPGDGSKDLLPLFETIVKHIPAPPGDPEGVFPLQGMNLYYSQFLAHIAIGRVFNGALKRGAHVGISKLDGKLTATRITKLYTFRGLERDDAQADPAGDCGASAGVEGINLGESITDLANPMPLEPLLIDEPTLAMIFTVNSSPLSGKEGT